MLISWLVAIAQAQTPPAIPIPLGAPPAPPAETRWLAADVVSERFPGETVSGPTFKAGEQVTVLVADGGKTRVFDEDRFGWVPSDKLAKVGPAPAAGGPPVDMSLLGGLPPLLPPKP